MTRKVYAKQVAPEHQESPLMAHGFPSFDEYYIDVTITGNDRYIGHRTDTFVSVVAGLENVNEDLLWRVGKDNWYSTITEGIHDVFPPQHKQKYNTNEVARWKQVFKDYAKAHESNRWPHEARDTICQAIELVTGKPFNWEQIIGCSQGDWQYVYYPTKEVSETAIRQLQSEYFNTGEEWIVHDSPVDEEDWDDGILPPEHIEGYSVYSHEYGDENVRKLIASCEGCDPSEVVLYSFEGYDMVPKYTLAA